MIFYLIISTLFPVRPGRRHVLSRGSDKTILECQVEPNPKLATVVEPKYSTCPPSSLAFLPLNAWEESFSLLSILCASVVTLQSI